MDISGRTSTDGQRHQAESLAGALAPWQGRGILLVDLDAFFASVEQLDHPEWRGQPVIVGGDADRRGVVSTASYEARVFGVHSAMPAAQARRLCPHAIWTNGRYDRYAEMSGYVMDILYDESPRLQQVSIDEAFLDVTPGQFTGASPIAVAERIRQRVSELGITCSVGVSTSKTVSKIASDMDKPNGLTVVFPGTERAFLAPLPVGRMSGIGKRTQARLAQLGIKTLGQLADLDDGAAHDLFGVNADSMRDRARGIDPSPIVTEEEVKSVSNEQTYAVDLRTREEIEPAIANLAARVGRRLRRKGLAGHTVTLKVKYPDLSIHTAQRGLLAATDDETEFGPVARALLDSVWQPGTALRLIGVAVSGFGQVEEQLSLFSEDEAAGQEPAGVDAGHPGKPAAKHRSAAARRQLIDATDRVKDRFGADAVRYGRELKLSDNTTHTMAQHKDEVDAHHTRHAERDGSASQTSDPSPLAPEDPGYSS